MVAIALFSAQPGEDSTNTSVSFISAVLKVFYPDFGNMAPSVQADLIESVHLLFRKGAHFSIYALLGLFVGCASLTYFCRQGTRLGLSFSICVAYAITDEIHQLFVPLRAGTVTDVIIDSCGSALGVVLAIVLIGLFFRKHIRTANN